MRNIKELRNELADNFKQLKEGSMDVKQATEMNNTAGKMIQTVMMELKQIEITGSNEQVPFLRYEEKDQLPENEVKELEQQLNK